jgi:hypothetical protein
MKPKPSLRPCPATPASGLDPGVLAKLKALRAPGESYSDVILRLATPAAAAPCPTLVFRDNGQLETRKGTRVEYEAASVGIHQAAEQIQLPRSLGSNAAGRLARELRLAKKRDSALFQPVANHVSVISKINPR